jgi:hypothetical protein
MTSRPRTAHSSLASCSGHSSPVHSMTRWHQVLAGDLLHLLDDPVVVVHDDAVHGAEPARERQRILAARDGDDGGADVRGQLGEQRAQEADADDGHRLAGADLAAAEDVDGAAERLAGHGLAGQRFGQLDHRAGVGQVVLGMGAVGEGGDAVADGHARHAGAHGRDPAPALVAGPARGLRVVEPAAALPQRQAGRAHARALELQQHLAGAGFRPRGILQHRLARCLDHARLHAGLLNARRRPAARPRGPACDGPAATRTGARCRRGPARAAASRWPVRRPGCR